MSVNQIDVRDHRGPLYASVPIAILLWATGILFLAVKIVPVDVYWISYYAVDYTFGFVRRGLAGEIVSLAPDGYYFDAAIAMRWVSTGVYLVSLAAVMGLVLFRGQRSERKMMLAWLIPVLPFAIPFSLYSARPDLFGAATLVVLGISLTFVKTPRCALACCAAYGCLAAVLGLIHEAIALEFSFGAILAVLVLAGGLTPAVQRRCVLLAIGPGLAIALLVAVFGRHDIGPKLCSVVPHRTMENPLATVTSFPRLMDYVFTAQRSQTDYHDWVCRNVLPIYNYSITGAMKVVAGIGVVPLLTSFVFGLLALAVTVYSIAHFSGVSLSSFLRPLQGRPAWPAFGLVLMIPVFLTGFDWTRWLIIISFNIVIVYILYALGRPELDEKPTNKTVQAFVLLVAALALIPIGTVPGFGGPHMV